MASKLTKEALEKAKADPYFDIVGLPSPLRRDKRKIPQTSTKQFVILLCFVPLWVGVIIPMGFVYQVALLICRVLGISKPPPRPAVDSGHKAPDSVKPRSERKYDIVVLGVTGFTGKLAARHLAQKYGVNKKIKWAIAGRSQAKLDATKQSLADELNMPEIVKEIDTILVDTADPDTVPALVKDTRVVATTAGPYQEYGNSVIEFCVKYGTHYTDITGEVGWIRHMIVQWGETAKKTGAMIVPFAGHDCIPWDLTVFKLNQILQNEFKDDLERVKIWDEAVAAAPGGTYATVLLQLEGQGVQSPRCKVDPFLQLATDGSKSTHTTKEDLPFFIDEFFDGRWTSPFVMAAVNAKIIRWTHALLQKGATKLSYRECLVHRDFKTAASYLLGLVMSVSLLMNPITKWLAYKMGALPKPGHGPSFEEMEKTNYLLVTAEGLGTNGNRVESTLYFSMDPGCLETAKMMVESGLAMAVSEKKGGNKLECGGGFWSPAAALGDVLLDRLVDAGAEYQSKAVPKPVPSDKDANKKDKDA